MVVQKRRTLSESVQDELRNLLMEDTYKVGDYLPSEQALATQFNVSRTTMRDAIGALVEKGFLERRQGKGVLVIDKSQTVLADSLRNLVLRGNCSLSEFLETRMLVESQIAYFAAKRATDKQIVALEDQIEKMLHSKNVKEYAYYDTLFHMKLAEAAQNGILLSIVKGIWPLLEQIVQHVVITDGKVESDSHLHKNILDAIRQHNADLAKQKMEEHLTVAEKMLRGSYEKQVSDIFN